MSRNSHDTRLARFPGTFRWAWVQQYGKTTFVWAARYLFGLIHLHLVLFNNPIGSLLLPLSL